MMLRTWTRFACFFSSCLAAPACTQSTKPDLSCSELGCSAEDLPPELRTDAGQTSSMRDAGSRSASRDASASSSSEPQRNTSDAPNTTSNTIDAGPGAAPGSDDPDASAADNRAKDNADTTGDDADGNANASDNGEERCVPYVDGRVEAHFVVPGVAGGNEVDFFQLPFPNDIRRTRSGLNLDGFPSRTAFVDRFLEATSTLTGFSAYPTITMRFSGPVDFDTFSQDLVMLNITDPENPKTLPYKYRYSPAGGNYVCHDSLSIRPGDGVALDPSGVYAVWLTRGGTGTNGLTIDAAPHLEAVLANDPPSDSALADAHSQFTPFRTYLAAAKIDPDTILNATVFTVEDPRGPMRQLAERVKMEHAETPPATSGWAKCEEGATSPCSQAEGGRACGAQQSAYDEFHALARLPIFQKGDAPYFDSGGAIATSGPERYEQVCISLTVPRRAAPETGWPIVLYGHGAGGSFRGGVRDEVAGTLSAIDNGTETVGFAVLGFDGVQHGPRRGTGNFSTLNPDLLLFNVANPDSARGTTLQAGADILSMVELAKSLSLPATVGGDSPPQFDVAQLFYWGHSQGGSQGVLGLPYAVGVKASVLSGTGAGIMHSLLLRTEPPEIAQGLIVGIQDQTSDGLLFNDEYHPALGLLQHWADAVDPLHHARHLASQPLSDQSPIHLFHLYGQGDTFSPGVNLKAFILAAKLGITEADSSASSPDSLGAADTLPVPVSANLSGTTAATRQYAPPEGQDGHFVAYDVGRANADIAHFFATSLTAASAPEIGE